MIVVSTVVTAIRNLALVAFTVEVSRLAWRFLGSAGRRSQARGMITASPTNRAGTSSGPTRPSLGSLDEARPAVDRCAASERAGLPTRTRKKATVAIVPDQHRPRRSTTPTSAPTTGCWRRCTSSTRPIPTRSTRPGPPTSGPTAHPGERQRPAGDQPAPAPAEPLPRRRTPPRQSSAPARARESKPAATKAAPAPAPAQADPDGGKQPAPASADRETPASKRTPTVETAGGDQGGPAHHPGCPGRRTRGSAQPGGPAQRHPGGAGQDRAPRRARADRQEHGHLADGADRDQRPLAAGQAADRPARGDQQPSAPGPRRQGLLHPPHRLRDGAGAQDAPGDEQRLRRGRRQADHGGAGPRQPRPGHRHAQARRHPAAAGAEHQELRDARLRAVLVRVRADRQEGPGRSADRRGLRRHHHHADQPRHHRHQPLGAAADAGPGRDHRRRLDGVPAGVPGLRPRQAGPDERLQGDDADLDLRPPGHPGRPVRAVPAAAARPAARRGRLLRRRVLGAADPVRADPLGDRTSPASTRTRSPSRRGSWR